MNGILKSIFSLLALTPQVSPEAIRGKVQLLGHLNKGVEAGVCQVEMGAIKAGALSSLPTSTSRIQWKGQKRVEDESSWSVLLLVEENPVWRANLLYIFILEK